jgi:hypothetical protein
MRIGRLCRLEAITENGIGKLIFFREYRRYRNETPMKWEKLDILILFLVKIVRPK